jgi:glycine/D-amino acid oxidase-like deaminating enzyme/nitrite reductase/ring-hydroxylating ferredoxin subunit
MINRDGYCTSLWQDSVPAYITTNKPVTGNIYDVIIVGGGITGITTAMQLQEAGKKCIVLEANNLCFGTTGGTTAHLNTLLDTPYTTIQKNFSKSRAQEVARVTAEAIQLVRNNIQRYNIDCGFSEADAFLFAQDDKQEKELAAIREASVEAGLHLTETARIPVPVPFIKAIQVSGQARFNPVRYVYALANAFEQAGGVIVQDCRVTGAEDNEMVEVETTRGVFKGTDLIYATHIPPGVNLLHLRCAPYRSYAMAVTLQDGNYPADLSYDMYDPYHYYRTQEVDGKKYLVAGGEDHKTGHAENTERCFLQLESHIRQHFKVREISYKWSSQYFEPADGLPYIGHLPGHPEHIYVATGFGGNGITYSQAAAIILKQLLLNEETVYTKLFDPNRLKPVAGFVNFIKHNADVVKEFAGRLFSGEDLDELASLAPGEGKLVEYEKKKIALYKDDDGTLHAASPVCKHLKCEVKWNNAERSWDCPCHGARYNFDGQVITGPSDADLETISLRSLVEK